MDNQKNYSNIYYLSIFDLYSIFRYLATDDSHQTIAFCFRVGRSAVSKIVKDVCQEIWNVLQSTYLPKPTTQTWIDAVERFSELWGFPNCLGSIGGKHIKLKYTFLNILKKWYRERY